MGQADPVRPNGPEHHTCTREPDFRQIREDLSADRRTVRERMVGVHTELREIHTKVDRVLEGLRIGAIVPARPTLSRVPDFDPDEQTNPGVHVDAAKLWKERTSVVLDAKAEVEIKLIDARAKARRMMIAAVAAAIATVLMAIAAVVQVVVGFGG